MRSNARSSSADASLFGAASAFADLLKGIASGIGVASPNVVTFAQTRCSTKSSAKAAFGPQRSGAVGVLLLQHSTKYDGFTVQLTRKPQSQVIASTCK